MLQTIEIIFRTTLAFILLLSIAHFLGKQTISQMTYHDFIGTIMLGAIAGNLAFNTSINTFYFLVALTTFTALLFLSTIISLKNRKLRAVFSGEPTVLIQGGKILDRNMKKLKFTLDSLNQALREKDVFDIDQVEYAVMEPDGHVSILKKVEHQHVTKKDIGVFHAGHASFPIELIMDGEIVEKNLNQYRLTKDWLYAELAHRGIMLNDVMYCVRGTNNQLYFDFYQDKIQSPIDMES